MSEWIKIIFHSAFEGSGTTLTTILNHVGSYGIAVHFCRVLEGVLAGGGTVLDAYERGARMVGHQVTIDNWCVGTPVFEKIQFLKHSPLLSEDGEWIPVLNYGCIFRSLGTVDGDLSAVMLGVEDAEFRCMPWLDRMDRVVAGVVRGMKNEPSSIVLDALRERFTKGTNEVKLRYEFDLLSADSDSADFVGQERLVFGKERAFSYITTASICRRYDLVENDLLNLVSAIHSITLGKDSVTEAVSGFYRVDYGIDME
jgi:hypothetical protein